MKASQSLSTYRGALGNSFEYQSFSTYNVLYMSNFSIIIYYIKLDYHVITLSFVNVNRLHQTTLNIVFFCVIDDLFQVLVILKFIIFPQIPNKECPNS